MAKGAKDVDIVLELENLHAFTDFLLTKNGLVGAFFHISPCRYRPLMPSSLMHYSVRSLSGVGWTVRRHEAVSQEGQV